MGPKMYFGVEAKKITQIDYYFSDKSLYGCNKKYPIPNSMAQCGNNCVEIFNECGIPKDFQKMFMVCNPISFHTSLASPSIIRKKDFFHRVKAKEILTAMPIYLSLSKNWDNVYGYMACEKPAFDVENCYRCKRDIVISFYKLLRAQGLMDNYLMALSKIMGIPIKSDVDSYKISTK